MWLQTQNRGNHVFKHKSEEITPVCVHVVLVTWTFGFVCGPLHTLAVNEGGDVGVGFHTFLLVTAPHTACGRTVLAVRLHVARHRAGRLVRVIKVIESIWSKMKGHMSITTDQQLLLTKSNYTPTESINTSKVYK